MPGGPRLLQRFMGHINVQTGACACVSVRACAVPEEVELAACVCSQLATWYIFASHACIICAAVTGTPTCSSRK